MPLTGAERQRRYRQKLIQENPEKLLQQKKENLERTKKKYKKVGELNYSEKSGEKKNKNVKMIKFIMKRQKTRQKKQNNACILVNYKKKI